MNIRGMFECPLEESPARTVKNADIGGSDRQTSRIRTDRETCDRAVDRLPMDNTAVLNVDDFKR